MIKKIDANKYGVVRYAISSIEDIADLPREVSVGSEAILVNEDGEKKFRLGSDGWVEVVEVKEYDEDKLRDILEDAKVGYRGIEYETLEERLEKDFDNAYSVLDNRTYVEYEGCRITAEDSLNGLQKETVIKGRTLQNIVKSYNSSGFHLRNAEMVSEGVFKLPEGTDVNHTNVKAYASNHLYKPNTTYTIFVDILENTTGKKLGISNFQSMINNSFEKNFQNLTGVNRIKIITTTDGLATDGSEPINGIYFGIWDANDTSGEFSKYIKFKYWILEGDYTQTPLEETPFIEGIESVGDKSKNLFDYNKLTYGHYFDPATGEYTTIVTGCATGYIKFNKCNITISGLYNQVSSYVGYYDINYNYIGRSSGNPVTEHKLTVGSVIADSSYRGYAVPANAEYITLNIYRNLAVNPNVTEEMIKENIKQVQIEEGAKATPYQPYYDGYKISGKSCGKNLAKEISEENYVAKGNGEVIFENNKCIAMDKSGWASCFISGKETIKVKPNTTYYGMVECEEGAEYLSQMKLIYKCYDKNNNVITTIGTVTMSNNANYFYTSSYNDVYEAFLPIPTHYKYVKFSSEVHSVKLIFRPTGSLGTITNTFKNILFVETDKQPTYEPYKETTYSYILDEPLRSLPNGVCDEIDLEKGIVTRRVGKYTFTGDESTFGEATEVTGDVTTTYLTIHDRAKGEADNIICNSLACYPYTVYENIQGILVSSFSCFVLSFKNGTLKSNDIEGIKQWLKDNPTTVYYELANPTTEYLIKDDKFVTLPNGVKDEISHNSVLRKVGKIVLDGSSDEKWEVWGTVGENVYKFVVPITNLKLVSGNPLLCNIFKYLSLANIDEEGIYNGNAGRMGLKISKTKLTSESTDELREWLSQNPITVWYELETPYTEPINPNEVILDTIRLKSYEPITHITSDNYLLPTIKTQVPSDFNAVVLGLKSNNEALASQVMSLRQTNDELETTNREQDDVIDVTLLALDEVYGMIDEGEIETMSMGSPMVNVYVKMIKRGIKTLDEVPTKYRAEVEELI